MHGPARFSKIEFLFFLWHRVTVCDDAFLAFGCLRFESSTSLFVAPGIIRTELLYKTHGEEGVAKLAAGVPLGLGETRDVGLACAYLCGEGGNYLTGICLDVNGGMYMH